MQAVIEVPELQPVTQHNLLLAKLFIVVPPEAA
jgi:hypothetical protein